MPITRRTHLATLAATGAVSLSAPMVSRALAADKLSIAVIPIADCAPIYLGKKKGFFAKQNLDITLSTQGGGAAIIPGVLSGQLQFGFSNVPSLLIAQNKGLKFVGVAPGVASTGVSGHDFSRDPRSRRQPDQNRQGPRRQDRRGQQSQQHRRRCGARGREGRRRRSKKLEIHRGAVSRHAGGACQSPHRGWLDGGAVRHHRAVARRQGGGLAAGRYCAESR